jgi:hypothetical protein
MRELVGAPVNVGGAGQGPAQNYFDMFGLNAEQRAAAQGLLGSVNPDTGEPYTAQETAALAASMFSTGPFTPPPKQFAPHAPPAFGGTEAGLRLQGALQMTQQGLIGEQQLAQIAAQAANDLELAGLNNEAAMARQLAGEVGAGARAELGERGATQRSLFGEMGAGARTQMETGTQRAIAAGQNVSDTFARMAEMMTSPSDYLKLAYNVQGMRPMADTPTDIARQEQQKFYQSQTGLAGAPQQTFSSIFQPMRETVSDLPSYGDLFQQGRKKVGGFQFGGRPSAGAAITGERGKPELVTGKDINVTPNLSKIEIRALRLGGVGGKQFGDVNLQERQRELSGGKRMPIPERYRQVLAQRQLNGSPAQSDSTTVSAPGAPTAPQNVFDIPQQRPGYEAPLFSGGYGRAAAGGVGAASGLAGLNPLDYSVQGVNRMLPFEQQMLMGRFGESVIDPATGEVIRAGMDPASVLEMIRRSSWVGGAPTRARWG